MKSKSKKAKEAKIEEQEVEKTFSEPVTFELNKKVFSDVIKAQTNYISQYSSCNILNGICVSMKDGILILASTDGNRLLKTEIQTNTDLNFSKIVFNGTYLSKIKILKSIMLKADKYLDLLEITLSTESMKIFDTLNNITYEIPKIEGEYPKYEQLIGTPKNAQKIAMNVRYLKDLKNLQVNERTNIVTFSFDKENKLSPVIAESDNNTGIKSTTLIMPVQIRE